MDEVETPVRAVAIARVFKLSLSGVYKLAADGKIPSIRAGRSVRFLPSAVAAALTAEDSQ